VVAVGLFRTVASLLYQFMHVDADFLIRGRRIMMKIG
jgi:hypothetical protein